MAITISKAHANAITHSGVFHADEVMATVILSKVFTDLRVLRTFKVPEDIADDAIVYDIGFGKFDHHQKGGNGKRENGVPYAACGLIWKEFGREFLNKTSPNPDVAWDMIDKNLISGIDAIDTGDYTPSEYITTPMTLSNVISTFNPTWDSGSSPDDAFLKAVEFATIIFDNVVSSTISKLNASQIIEAAIEASDSHIMVLDRFAPWQDYIFTSKNPKASNILFVVFPSLRGGFNWQCVPTSFGSFEQRKSVPDSWKGASKEELVKLTGIKTATFCHPAGFLGSCDTLDDCVKMAMLATKS